MEKKDWIILVVFVLGVGTFILSYLEKWINIQFRYFVVIIAFLIILFLIWNRKSSRELKWNQALDMLLPVLVKQGILSDDVQPKIKWFAERRDKAKILGVDCVWDFEIEDEKGRSHAVFVDKKTGQIKVGAFGMKPRDPPVKWEQEEVMVITKDRNRGKDVIG